MKNIFSGLLLLIPFTLFAQIPSIDWQYTTGVPAFGSAAAADLDKDGMLEIVFTTYTNDGRAHCLNAEDGSFNKTFNIDNALIQTEPTLVDVHCDGAMDIVVANWNHDDGYHIYAVGLPQSSGH